MDTPTSNPARSKHCSKVCNSSKESLPVDGASVNEESIETVWNTGNERILTAKYLQAISNRKLKPIKSAIEAHSAWLSNLILRTMSMEVSRRDMSGGSIEGSFCVLSGLQEAGLRAAVIKASAIPWNGSVTEVLPFVLVRVNATLKCHLENMGFDVGHLNVALSESKSHNIENCKRSCRMRKTNAILSALDVHYRLYFNEVEDDQASRSSWIPWQWFARFGNSSCTLPSQIMGIKLSRPATSDSSGKFGEVFNDSSSPRIASTEQTEKGSVVTDWSLVDEHCLTASFLREISSRNWKAMHTKFEAEFTWLSKSIIKIISTEVSQMEMSQIMKGSFNVDEGFRDAVIEAPAGIQWPHPVVEMLSSIAKRVESQVETHFEEMEFDIETLTVDVDDWRMGGVEDEHQPEQKTKTILNGLHVRYVFHPLKC